MKSDSEYVPGAIRITSPSSAFWRAATTDGTSSGTWNILEPDRLATGGAELEIDDIDWIENVEGLEGGGGMVIVLGPLWGDETEAVENVLEYHTVRYSVHSSTNLRKGVDVPVVTCPR